ncbi:uncharacterized protein LOC131637147 [Vicia villosa]|uniref:uncharacterized protein LOC131637147 n=1 Tax=Vicia villosa TaxID=3911 RepID=UPI00273CCF7F|nr:uncharacterized protein LOC131637147 [Vicia villosa]
MNDDFAYSFWRNADIGFSFSNSVGRSGGLITLWKKNNMEVLHSFKGEGFLEAFRDGEWIIGGDFNAIKNVRERKGRAGVVNKKEAELFADFIHKSALVDIPCKGKKYTWFSRDGKSMSRIDRFLLSHKVVNRWEVIGKMIDDRDISDHYPIWILTDKYNWGPKPFKFNNEWFLFDSFIPFVEKEWKSLKVEGRGDFVLKEKLRLLKDKLKRWNKDVFGKIDLDIEEGVNDINLADERLDSIPFANSSFEENLLFEKRRRVVFGGI